MGGKERQQQQQIPVRGRDVQELRKELQKRKLALANASAAAAANAAGASTGCCPMETLQEHAMARKRKAGEAERDARTVEREDAGVRRFNSGIEGQPCKSLRRAAVANGSIMQSLRSYASLPCTLSSSSAAGNEAAGEGGEDPGLGLMLFGVHMGTSNLG